MIYEVRLNPISGSQELVSLAGVSSSTIGCAWKSTDAYACITDCADCSLGMVNNAATQLGYTASASNSSTAIGLCATACCTSTAIGNGACDIGDNEIHIKGGSAEVISKCNCINISNGGSTVIDVSVTALNACSEANIYLNVACDCIDIKGCTAVVNVGTNSVAIGNGATATCGIDIKGANSEVRLDNTGAVIVGTYNTVCNTGNTVIGGNQCTGSGTADTVVIGQSNSIPDACNISEAVVIGDLGEIGTDYAGSISSGDVIIGGYLSGPFKYCASNGYTYSNEKLMTGRILECAAELPASNCSLLLYYVP